MSELYHSPYEAYPFLSDEAEDLRCDFETAHRRDGKPHRAAPGAGTGPWAEEGIAVALRTDLPHQPHFAHHLTVTRQECDRLLGMASRLKEECSSAANSLSSPRAAKRPVPPTLLRVQGKQLVRLIYRHARQGHPVPVDAVGSGQPAFRLLFLLALKLNQLEGWRKSPTRAGIHRYP